MKLLSVKKLKYFFTIGCFPEIVGKWYSRGPVADSLELYQFHMLLLPQKLEKVTMKMIQGDCGVTVANQALECDNKRCTIFRFHFDCLELRTAPKGKWYCPSCRLLIDQKRSSYSTGTTGDTY